MTLPLADIEGGTARWGRHPEARAAALARHDALLRAAIAARGGHVFKTIGDAFCAALAGALAAALAVQRALHAEPWGPVGPLRVRMARHTGAAEERDGDFFGASLHRANC